MKKCFVRVHPVAAVLFATAAVLSLPAAADEPWNQAVRIERDGKRTVELPPSGGRRAMPAPRLWEPPVPGRTYVIEGPSHLVECVQPFYQGDRTCTRYVPGMYRLERSRAWVVKRGASWLRCPEPNSEIGCVGLFSKDFTPFKPQP